MQQQVVSPLMSLLLVSCLFLYITLCVASASLPTVVYSAEEDAPFGTAQYPVCTKAAINTTNKFAAAIYLLVDVAESGVWRSLSGGDAGTWRQQADNPFGSVEDATANRLANGNLLVFGGELPNSWSNTVWLSSDDGVSWSFATKNAAWSARGQAVSVALPYTNTVVLLGGFDGDTRLPHTNSTWISRDGVGAVWSETVAPDDQSYPDQLAFAAAVALYDQTSTSPPTIVLGGGQIYNYYNDVYISTNLGHSWQHSVPPWQPRTGHQLIADSDDYVYVVGGNADDQIWISQDKAATWNQLTTSDDIGWLFTCIAIRHVVSNITSTVTVNKQIIFYAGYRTQNFKVFPIGTLYGTLVDSNTTSTSQRGAPALQSTQ